MVFAPGFGLTLIKKVNPKSKPSHSDISDAHKNARGKRDNYVTQKSDELKEDYKKDIKNKSVSYMKQKHDFNDIEKGAEYINFEVQCKFYNDELKQYGIELIYIVP